MLTHRLDHARHIEAEHKWGHRHVKVFELIGDEIGRVWYHRAGIDFDEDVFWTWNRLGDSAQLQGLADLRHAGDSYLCHSVRGSKGRTVLLGMSIRDRSRIA